MTSKFQIGKSYATRSFCDYDTVFSFDVVARTAKTVTIKWHDQITRRKVRDFDGVEAIDPLGRYSMSPVLTATDIAI